MSARWLSIAGLALGLQGCMWRSIVNVQDGPAGADMTTLVRTKDTKFFGVMAVEKDVFWECADVDGKLVCKKACDVKDDKGQTLACPRRVLGGG